MTSAVQTRDLTRRFKRFTAVNCLNLEIPRGEVFGLLGPNGAGKTTTILMLLGNVRPTSGEALMLGLPPGNLNARRQVGYLPEKFQFHDFLTATEFLQLHGKLACMSAQERAKRIPQVLERVGLADRAGSRLREFSKGMQQRIGLAQAILHSPELIILDEPTSALDPLGRRDVRDIVTELRNEGKTVILNSHLLSEVEMTCDHIAIMKKGRVAVQGSVSEMLSFSHRVEVEVAQFSDAAMTAIQKVVTRLRITKLPVTRFSAWVQNEEDIPLLAQTLIQNGVLLKALVPQRETLEEMFVRVVEEEEKQ